MESTQSVLYYINHLVSYTVFFIARFYPQMNEFLWDLLKIADSGIETETSDQNMGERPGTIYIRLVETQEFLHMEFTL